MNDTGSQVPGLRRELKIWEAIALSIGLTAPTAAMALNGGGAAAILGRAAPLAFVLSGVVIALVAFSIIRLSRFVSDAGSTFSLTRATLGTKVGMICGWALLGCYICYCTASVCESGSFLHSFFANVGLQNVDWIFITLPVALIVWGFVHGDIRVSTRFLLSAEGISVSIVVLVMIVIIARIASGHAPDGQTITASVFKPTQGVGAGALSLGAIFGFLSFAGFEASASLGEETDNPRRAIPRAITIAVITAIVFFLLCVTIQSLGFGTSASQVHAFASSADPLAQLSGTYVFGALTPIVNLFAGISVFAAAIAASSGASRMLYALSKARLVPEPFSRTSQRFGSPSTAAAVVMGLVLSGALLQQFLGISATNAFFYPGTIGTLCILVAYLLTSLGALRFIATGRGKYIKLEHVPTSSERAMAVVPLLAISALVYTIYKQLVPSPTFPYDVFPYVVVGWLLLGGAILVLAESRRKGRDSKSTETLALSIESEDF